MSHYSKCMVIKVHFSHFVCVSGVAFLRLTVQPFKSMGMESSRYLKNVNNVNERSASASNSILMKLGYVGSSGGLAETNAAE